ncbi:peptidoglycan-binding protein [Anabaena sphaerica]|nr:peptidoglycan-binding protein [Anabaena sphaerica]
MRDNKQLLITKYQLPITNHQSPITHCILIFASCLSLGLFPNLVISATPNPAPNQQAILIPGMRGSEVQVLQIQLKALGYYKDLIDGLYGISTQAALSKFQKAQGLKRTDGIADITTQTILTKAVSVQTQCTTSPASPAPTPQINTKSQPSQRDFIWWSLLGLGLLGTIGAVVYLIKKFGKVPQLAGSEDQKLLKPSPDHHPKFFLNPAQTATLPISTELVPIETGTLIPKLNLFDELIKDLRCHDSNKRRKAIWNLGQQGDSRAVQPLVDLMIDADSQQQGLILSALAEIGTCTLKPMNRALAISMQDENPQVRKNAIRDLVRIYDTMGQMSKIVFHALEDPDPEVQETAKYALNQMDRIRRIPREQILGDMKTEELLE